jgi:hypothetical protein
MNVVCIKPTTKLIKGASYRVAQFINHNTRGSVYFRPTIRIFLTDSSIQVFPLQNFKPVDGSDFVQINWICPEYQLFLNEREQTKIDKNLKSGDFVIPIYDSLKTLIKGRIYRVKEVSIIDHKSSSGYSSWSDIKIKLEGSSRYYSSWNFRKCTQQESREIGLKQIFDEKVNTEKVNRHKRKFDYYNDDEKKTLLIKFLIESANDRFRHQSSIIDWAVMKSAVKYKLTSEDFDVVLNLPISEMLDILK